MPRKIVVRRESLNTAISQLEKMVREDYKTIWRNHIKDLERIAEWTVQDAKELVPVLSGVLRSSIQARVSRSNRYPGIIVEASAKNVNTGFDYAIMQEEEESYEHPGGGQAHFLSEPFFNLLDEFYYNETGAHLPYPDWFGR